MMLRLCTALLLTNKLSPDQIDQLKTVANKAIGENWSNSKDCTEFINKTALGITAVEKWEEVHDSRGGEETFEVSQEMTSLTSANASLQQEITISVKNVPFYLGKASAATSFQMRDETASSETKKMSTHQTFPFTKGERRILAKKVMHVKQVAASKNFFVAFESFTVKDFISVTGLTPKNGVVLASGALD